MARTCFNSVDAPRFGKRSGVLAPIRFVLQLAAVVATIACLGTQAQAQQWPSRPVKVVVPYGAGGVTDTLARLTAERLTRTFGQSFYIENRPGAGGTIGVTNVIRGPADGYTLLFIGGAQFSVVPLIQDVTYDPIKELAPISISGINGSVLAVPVDAPYETLKDFLQYARDNPGKVAYSTAGPATVTHLVAALLAGRANIDLTHVPFKGGPDALRALIANSVQMHFGNSSDMIEPVRAGAVKALGVSTSAPMPQIPTVPPVAGTIPNFELLGWNGYFAPAGTPKEIVAQLSTALRKIAQDPELKSRLNSLGIETTSYTPEEITEIINKDIRLYSEIVDMARLRRK